MLFLSGQRVRSILLTTAEHINTLINFLEESGFAGGGIFSFPGIKSASAKPINIPLPGSARPFIQECLKDLERLRWGREPQDFVIRQSEFCSQVLSITTLTKRLNKILIEVSKRTGKLLRTHSFRIGLTTSLSMTGSVELAQNVIGHRDFRTTASYSRHTYTQQQITKALAATYVRAAPRKRKISQISDDYNHNENEPYELVYD